jgi:hypothetical protein
MEPQSAAQEIIQLIRSQRNCCRVQNAIEAAFAEAVKSRAQTRRRRLSQIANHDSADGPQLT